MKIDPSFIMYDNECQLKFNIDMISIAVRWLRISQTGKLCFCVCKLELKLKLFIKKKAKKASKVEVYSCCLNFEKTAVPN